ncbi:hypothetical protein SAMN02745823_03164 [Sporobacter termitidis DSM 10068]|uniref:Bacterial repeat domain-containing protein n=1 Tax=Sporobacter termitidis DSM 10068 TaxID=1123282 RepID=A0A1M5Z3F4_9FIRM|nr:hypothetical protein [Sporobacter termitidis]SHI18786.1 hypothetical protein SAMN02745823_03164 [Sporobacter termitidis DSM 10068]
MKKVFLSNFKKTTKRLFIFLVVALLAFCPLTGFTAYAGESDGGSAPVEPAPVEPVPTEPVPTEPAPTEPAPTEPAPTEPVPEPTPNPVPGLYAIEIFITDLEGSIIDDLGEANGTVTADFTEAAENDEITLTITPENGYRLDTLMLSYGEEAREIDVSEIEGGTYAFAMPANDVAVTASFAAEVKPLAKSLADGPYSININTVTNYFPDDNDSKYSVLSAVTADATDDKAEAGQEVTLTITPAKRASLGYEHSLRELTLTYEGEEPIKVDVLKAVTNGRAGGQYTFTMPAKNVTVDAVFGPYTFMFPKTLEGGEFKTTNLLNDCAKHLGFSEDGKYEIWGCLSGISVYLAVTAKDGYILKADSAKYTSEDGTETLLPVSDINKITVTDRMPKADIVFSADFIAAETKFNIGVGEIANGTVRADKTQAMAGEAIKLTVTPNKGYTLATGSLKYTYAGGKLSGNITVPTGTVFTNAAPVTLTMTMPQTDIVVAAEFGPATIITFDPTIKNGSLAVPYGALKLSDNSFLSTPGTQYYISNNPNTGYMMKVGSLKYTADGGLTYLPLLNDTPFIVPATDATITAEFVASGSVAVGTVEVDYNGNETEIFEVPITFTTPSSGGVQRFEPRLQYEAGGAVAFKYLRIGGTKLLEAGATSGTDPVTGWVASNLTVLEYSTNSFHYLYLAPGNVTENPDVDFEENTQYTVYVGFALKPNLVVGEIPITNTSRFNTGINPINTNGAIKINWTGATPPFTTLKGVNTYYLSNPEQLMWFADEINTKHSTTSAALLNANIDMTGYAGPNGEKFEGIGTEEYPLQQTFNGNGKTVTYELTHDSGDGPVGFVRNTTAAVQSLTVNGTITVTGGSPDAGLAVGRTSAAVSGVTVNGTITVTGGTPNVGGVVGRTSANITGSTSKATISVSENAGGNIGGIAGLFDNGSTATGSLNTNVHLGTVDVRPGSTEAVVGGIVGSANGKVNFYSNGNGGAWSAASPDSGGSVQGRGVTGGIVGYMGASSTTGNYQNTNFGTVSGGGTSALGSATGGIFGIAGENVTVIGHATKDGSYSSNRYNNLNMNYGSVSGDTRYVGGIVGELRGASTIIRYSYNEGEITSSSAQPGAAVGGIVGGAAGGAGLTIENNISKGGVKATGGAARGGLIGYAASTMPQLDSLAEGKLNYFAQAPDLAGYPGMPETPGISGKPAALLSPLGYSSEYNGPGGDGSAENPYQLANYEQLAWFAESVNGTRSLGGQSYNVILVDDIDISAYPDFVGIGTYSRPYMGVFDGGGFSIKLALENGGSDVSSARDFAALFGYCDGATIKNLTTTGTVNSARNAAGVAYKLEDGTIEHVRNEAKITAGRIAAGVLLTGDGVTLKDIVNTGDITSTKALLLPNEIANGSPPANCTGRASGVVDSLISHSATVDRCVNEGNIAAAYQAAGVIGSISTSSIYNPFVSVTNCKNSGTVESFASLSLDSGAWLSATHFQYRCTAAGIVGWVAEGTFVISNCENSGTIKCSGNNVAGILGSVGIGNGFVETNITVKDCKNTGAIISTYTGGSNFNKISIAGIFANAAGSTGTGAPQSTGVTVTGNENTGPISADARVKVGAIVGRDPGSADYDSSGNKTNQFYGDDEEDAGVEKSTLGQPGNTDDPGDGGGANPTVPGKDPEAPKVPVAVTPDGPAEVQKVPTAEGSVTAQDTSYERRPASPAERINLKEQPQEEALRADEATNEETPPKDQPNENSLDVAASDMERTVENSPFVAVALGVAGAGALGGGGYALFRSLRRRRVG